MLKSLIVLLVLISIAITCLGGCSLAGSCMQGCGHAINSVGGSLKNL